MVLGKPVVASRVGGVPYMIEDRYTGLLYEPGDIPELANCLRSLLDDAQWRASIGQRARALARSTYAPDQIAAATVDVYRQLLHWTL
jgi:rhamnosyl/mannosyltransferase